MNCEEDDPKGNPPSSGHQFQFKANTESRKTGLKRLQELMQKNLGLRPIEKNEDRDKRDISSHHHQTVHQPVQHHVPLQHAADCAPDYIVEYVEYHYYPQDYCY